MNSNVQEITQEDKFRIKDFIIVFKEIFATKKELEESELNKKVEDVRNKQDSSYIEKLEKEIGNYERVLKRGTKVKTKPVKSANFNTKNVKAKVKDEKDNIVLEDYEK